MKKKKKKLLILIPIFILIPIALILVYHFFIYRIVELKQIEIKSTNIVKMINNKKVVKDEFSLNVKNESNKKLYNDLSDYFKDITTSTNKMNDDSIETMHKFCDNQGPTIIIIKANGKIFVIYVDTKGKR